MELKTQKHQQLVLVPFPFQGHITPMLQLGTILHSKGFSITIAHTTFNFPNPSNLPHFNFLQFTEGLSDSDLTRGFPAFISALNINCKVPFEECLTQMIKDQDRLDNLPWIIYDGNMHFAEAVAHNLKLPSVILRTSSAASSLAYYAFPRLQNEGYIPLQDSSSLDELVPGLHPLRFKDLPFANSKSLDIANELVNVARNTGSSSAIIWNSADCLENSSLVQLRQKFQIPVFPLGPLHKIYQSPSSSVLEEDTGCIAWLDKQAPNSVIYVSLGSIVSMEEKELIEMAWGLANSKQPFLWVLRPATVNCSKWPDLLPEGFKEIVEERGCIVKWAPQKKVLAHNAVGGFWSHCGWNSTMESLSEGVPLICRPSFGDQRVNARFLSTVWKVGLELANELVRGEIERAIKMLMSGKEGEEMKQRATKFKEKIELSVQTSGISHSSLNELVELIMSV